MLYTIGSNCKRFLAKSSKRDEVQLLDYKISFRNASSYVALNCKLILHKRLT
jgi:hypothetical protein